MKSKKNFSVSLCVSAFLLLFIYSAEAQNRSRIVTTAAQPTTTGESRPINQPIQTETVRKTVLSSPTNAPNPNIYSRPVLINKIVVGQSQQPLIVKTVSSQPVTTTAASSVISRLNYSSATSSMLMNGIQNLYGIPYRYGSTGPNRYDCSGFVWTVFQRAGIFFERSSARTFWNEFEPVSGDDRFKFGTLVFFNKLGHIGIVADEKGFYHASSSKGITYSTFAGYWEKRIVGFRRVPAQMYQTAVQK